MEDCGYYTIITDGVRDTRDDVSKADFFHGHLLAVNGGQYGSVDEFLRDASLILYHTEEMTSRWEIETLFTPENRAPRSIVGYRDGGTLPAIEITGQQGLANPKIYDEVGTVFGRDIIAKYPRLTDGSDYPARPRIVADGRACTPDYQFLIRPREDGRFSSRTQRFEVTVRCHLEKEAADMPPATGS